ncbi:MAG TPA: hypothetical protein DEV81_19225 [Cyanobacteria bacterium UBA11049]|nr:hypothetical protein [Cyanobacteria bacterium UBA11049]
MKSLNLPTSACRYCRYYQPEGRRGGLCQTLGAPVQGSWKACALAIPAFPPAWEGLEEMVFLSGSPPVLASCSVASALDSAIDTSGMESSEPTAVAYAVEPRKAEALLA